MDKSSTELIHANDDQEQPGNFGEILQIKAKIAKYLKEKC